MKLDSLHESDPMNPEVEIPGYGVMDLKTLKVNIRRQLSDLAAEVAETDNPRAWRNLHYLLNQGVLEAKVQAVIDAHDDLQAQYSKGGIKSRGIEKE